MTALKGPVLFRADAGPTIGVGHVMRCLALAQRLLDSGYDAVFAVAECPVPLRERLAREQIRVIDIAAARGTAEDASETVALATKLACEWVVLDGYAFDQRFHERHRKAAKLLAFDDNGDVSHHVADLVLNQNVHADEALYASREAHTELLLGPRFASLRREVLEAARAQGDRDGRRLVITFGGSDPADLSSRALEVAPAWVQAGLDVTLVMGGAAARAEELRQRAEHSRGVTVVVDPTDLAARLASANVALCAGGVTSLELAYLGVPSLLVVVADNQRAPAAALVANGAARSLGDAESVTPESLRDAVLALVDDTAARQRMGAAARALVDGEGSARVLSALGGRPMTLRRAGAGDARLLFDWTNDPVVRASSFVTKPVEWEEHLRWFEARLASATSALYVASDEAGRPLGLVRFELRDEGRAEVGVNVASTHRGQGRAAPLIRAGTKALWREYGPRPVDAYIRPDNEASLRAFHKAGYVDEGTTTVKGVAAVRTVCRPEE